MGAELRYILLSQRLKEEPDSISDAEAEAALQAIEAGIHGAKNRARSNMNTALIRLVPAKPSFACGGGAGCGSSHGSG